MSITGGPDALRLAHRFLISPSLQCTLYFKSSSVEFRTDGRTVIDFRNFELIIILETDKISREVRNKLLKGLSLIGMPDKEIVFRKSIRFFIIN
jgi:hypothetical protein